MAGEKHIHKLLIANRGEVAVRIARACAELGIESVAVASHADRRALHARVADRVVTIGPAPAAQSYLRGDRIIAAARDTACEAIHPGYGFLSQNAEFADRVRSAGLLFVGPPGDAMRIMGDKRAARKTMHAAGVKVVPGFEGAGDENVEELRRAALDIGFPLLVKAAAGGGGRGMRLVTDPDGLDGALESARREAEKAFGDGRLFLELFLAGARHVEIQVLADGHGHYIHLLERECSIQRRYQKILEESPSPLLDERLRKQMGATAVRAARACGYVGAGTVEFLVTPGREAFFLEMNTRLQVEHPVTELVTGVDIVAWQIRLAAGAVLSLAQKDICARGHAIECRINAEDPDSDFAPSAGKLLAVSFPQGPGIRVDKGVESGDEVTLEYDSLLAKVLVHGEDRGAAIRRMEQALDRVAVLGVHTNVEFLRGILAHPRFLAGDTSTTFVADEMSEWRQARDGVHPHALIAMALAEGSLGSVLEPGEGSGRRPEVQSPWYATDGFRLGS